MSSNERSGSATRGKPWTADENAAVIKAYFWMLDQDQNERPYNKAATYRKLEAGALAGRNVKSIERKMQNISAVLHRHEVGHVRGLKPLSNVQTKLAISVEETLVARGMIDSEAPGNGDD